MDPDLEGVWSVTCLVVGRGFRRLGLMYELAVATVVVLVPGAGRRGSESSDRVLFGGRPWSDDGKDHPG